MIHTDMVNLQSRTEVCPEQSIYSTPTIYTTDRA